MTTFSSRKFLLLGTLLCSLFMTPQVVQAHGSPAPIVDPVVAPAQPAAGQPASGQPGDAQATSQIFLPLIAQPGATPGGLDQHDQNDYTLAAQARLRNEPRFVLPATAAAAPQDLINVGQWGPVVTWPFAFASVANLPDGRVVAWGADSPTSFDGAGNTWAAIWNPAGGQFLIRNTVDHSMFCGIPVMLEDGRIFVNGGDGTRERTSTFDFRTNQWTRIDDMHVGRWYPGSVALPTGKVFTALGDPGSRYPELWTPNAGWSYLTGADLQAAILNFSGYQNNWLPYFFLNADGRIFHAGPTQQMNWIDPTGNGSIVAAGLDNTWYPKYAAAVMYDEGKILVAGGQVNGNELTGTNRARIIDLTGPTPTTTEVAPMTYARKYDNAVALPTEDRPEHSTCRKSRAEWASNLAIAWRSLERSMPGQQRGPWGQAGLPAPAPKGPHHFI